MPMQSDIRRLALYSLGHFWVDLVSSAVMVSLVTDAPEVRMELLLIYNFCAFALQMPLGLLVDRPGRDALTAMLALLPILLSLLAYPSPLLCAALLGIGNCLYHIGGGCDVLRFGGESQWMLGVFVSPGAIGLYLGALGISSGSSMLLSCAVGTTVIGLLLGLGLWNTRSTDRDQAKPPPVSLETRGRAPVLAAILLFAVVILRSYVGATLALPWKSGWLVPLSVLALAIGKAAGGFLADRFGSMRTSVLSLLLSAVLFLFSKEAHCGLLAILLFNMTMPLTLFALSRLLPRARGFAFGLLTFALFLGALPSLLSLPGLFPGDGRWYAAEALLSLLLLAAGIWCVGGKHHE